MTRAYIILRENGKTVCKLYKTADGYPSALQAIIKQLKGPRGFRHNSFIRELLQTLLINDLLLPCNASTKSIDYWYYIYEIDEFRVKMVPHEQTSMSRASYTLEEFVGEDFSKEWAER